MRRAGPVGEPHSRTVRSAPAEASSSPPPYGTTQTPVTGPACTHSTLMLASQARKYGLGLVFATQAPKALHNRIPGNAATQFFGLLTSMTQIDAAQEIARVKGSPIPDVGRLGRGEFYAAVEGAGFVKMRAPFCLSHHPPSPLTAEEVVQRAATRS